MCPDSDDTSPLPPGEGQGEGGQGSGVLGNGTDAAYDRVEYQYNREGQQTQVKDQNQTVHDDVFDALGRQTADKVTLAEGNPHDIDDRVLRIERSYEARGFQTIGRDYNEQRRTRPRETP